MAQEFDKSLLKIPGTILVSFKSGWCGPCKLLTPILEELSADGYSVYTVDIDKDDDDLAVRHAVRSVPTTVVFKDGLEVERMTGMQTRQKLITSLT